MEDTDITFFTASGLHDIISRSGDQEMEQSETAVTRNPYLATTVLPEGMLVGEGSHLLL